MTNQTKQRQKSSEVFRSQCVATCRHRGKQSLADVALSLNVGQSTLSKWVKQSNLANAGDPETSDEKTQAILKLQKENLQLKNENDFLKKISFYFAQEAPQPFKKQ